MKSFGRVRESDHDVVRLAAESAHAMSSTCDDRCIPDQAHIYVADLERLNHVNTRLEHISQNVCVVSARQ